MKELDNGIRTMLPSYNLTTMYTTHRVIIIIPRILMQTFRFHTQVNAFLFHTQVGCTNLKRFFLNQGVISEKALNYNMTDAWEHQRLEDRFL